MALQSAVKSALHARLLQGPQRCAARLTDLLDGHQHGCQWVAMLEGPQEDRENELLLLAAAQGATASGAQASPDEASRGTLSGAAAAGKEGGERNFAQACART